MRQVFYTFLIIFIFTSVNKVCNAQEIIVLSTFEFPPEHSKELPHHGIVSHIIELAFAKEDIKVKWQYYPVTRAFMMAKSGRVDGTASYGYSKEREDGMYISDSIITSTTYFYHLKTTKFHWEGIKDLAELTVGITNNFNYGDDFNKALKDKIFTGDNSNHDILNLNKLLAARIDIFPMTSGIAEYLLMTRFPKGALEKITYNKKPVKEYDSFIYFPQTLASSIFILERFNQGLKKLKSSGQYQQILSNFPKEHYAISAVDNKE